MSQAGRGKLSRPKEREWGGEAGVGRCVSNFLEGSQLPRSPAAWTWVCSFIFPSSMSSPVKRANSGNLSRAD